MEKLSKQEKIVYDYIRNNPGCTTHMITRDTFVQKPCARMVGLKNKGVEIEVVGTVKYPGTKAFVKYAIGKPLTKLVSKVEVRDGVAYETRVKVVL